MKNMTLEQYAKSNFRFLDIYQSMLFISNYAEMKGTYVSVNKKGEHNMVYVFEKNKFNEDLLTTYHQKKLTWGDNVITFEN